jgi:hypothetical protein
MKRVLMQAGTLIMSMTMINLLSVQIAYGAPGEDTIQLNGPVKYVAMPGGPREQSGGMDGPTDIPAWMRARMTRYVAKAYSATGEDGSIYTDSDVVTTVQTEGLRKTCTQEVGSNTVPSGDSMGTRYGPQARDQVVVLRGDLVNVCR